MREHGYSIELSSDPEFSEKVNELSKDIDEIVETGTNLGTGSTKVFAKTGKPVISIECNGFNYNKALDNLEEYKNVKLIHGHSLKISDMVNFIREDDIYEKNLEIGVENPQNPKAFYLYEIGFESEKEDVLWDLINNDKKQIILLDSAGGVGYLEFRKFMELPDEFKKNKILILDDVSHVKHYRSAQELGDKFNYSKSKRWGWYNG